MGATAGAIHLLNGLYDAKLDHQPVVAIVGQTFVRALGGSFQQEVKLLQLYSDVASAYCEQVNEPGSIRHLLRPAAAVADTLGRWHRQGAARQGRGPRRRAVLHRADRAAGHQAVVGHDDGL